jgi:hypothetical protein
MGLGCVLRARLLYQYMNVLCTVYSSSRRATRDVYRYMSDFVRSESQSGAWFLSLQWIPRQQHVSNLCQRRVNPCSETGCD